MQYEFVLVKHDNWQWRMLTLVIYCYGKFFFMEMEKVENFSQIFIKKISEKNYKVKDYMEEEGRKEEMGLRLSKALQEQRFSNSLKE